MHLLTAIRSISQSIVLKSKSRVSTWMILFAACGLFSVPAHADSVTLLSTHLAGGVYFYLYGITTTDDTTWTVGEVLEFSGIGELAGAGEAGVTLEAFGVSLGGAMGTATFTADSPIILASGATYGTLDVDSYSPDVGLIGYSSTSDPTFSGMVEGPVAPTPEIPSFVLLGAGLLALSGIGAFSKR